MYEPTLEPRSEPAMEPPIPPITAPTMAPMAAPPGPTLLPIKAPNFTVTYSHAMPPAHTPISLPALFSIASPTVSATPDQLSISDGLVSDM